GALTGTRGAVRTGGVVPPGTSASPAAPKEAPAAPKATPVATKATAAPTSRFPAKDWTRHYAEGVRETLAAAIENPSPDAGNRIVVPKGSILLSGDIPASSSPPDIVLDGGKLLFSPPSRELRQVIDRCERFIAAAPDDTEEVPSNIVPKRTEWFASRILVTSRGGSAADADADIRAYVTNDVRRAPGTEAATLDVAGFSSIVLERRLLDPGLTITGYGSVADFLPSGLLRNRRWFDTDDPL
ncbi:MAG: hypothetical protein IJS46_05735, partial [Kiritimatiellae bacterium]|nr:hypothetical protein [Kiritimatiellia bacterium]